MKTVTRPVFDVLSVVKGFLHQNVFNGLFCLHYNAACWKICRRYLKCYHFKYERNKESAFFNATRRNCYWKNPQQQLIKKNNLQIIVIKERAEEMEQDLVNGVSELMEMDT